MKKVYLYVQFIEHGFSTEYKPLMVFDSKKDADEYLTKNSWGKVVEIDYVGH